MNEVKLTYSSKHIDRKFEAAYKAFMTRQGFDLQIDEIDRVRELRTLKFVKVEPKRNDR